MSRIQLSIPMLLLFIVLLGAAQSLSSLADPHTSVGFLVGVVNNTQAVNLSDMSSVKARLNTVLST